MEENKESKPEDELNTDEVRDDEDVSDEKVEETEVDSPETDDVEESEASSDKKKKEKKQKKRKTKDGEVLDGRELARRHRMMEGAGACTVSMLVHVILVLVLGLWMMPEIVADVRRQIVAQTMDEPEEELQTVVLDENLEAATEPIFANEAAAAAAAAPDVAAPELTQNIETDQGDLKVNVGDTAMEIIGTGNLINGVPDGTLGQSRAVSKGYGNAMDRITQELLWMLSKSKVLVVWCFDQSESMKDDQEKIQGRIDRIYKELGLSDASVGDALTTAVTSYGKGFTIHTEKPTYDIEKIRAAIRAVPIDKSGKEMMCQAVGRSIVMFKKVAVRGKRRMALILVTDESGEPKDNDQYLEQLIAECKAARCRIFILGREAVFGYPFAHFRWTHPQTGRPHWLPVNRGPETAFIEQMQTNGFERRYDAYSSGFGPYAQSRLAHQTGGIFFMLPSPEAKLVRAAGKRRYELDAMRGYEPDLRAKSKILRDRDSSKLRMAIWKIVNDLNPHKSKQTAEVVELRVRFSTKPDEFRKQVAKEVAKARIYIPYLEKAAKAMEHIKRLRNEDPSPRWKGNYDLLYAQLLAYRVRSYEYILCLQEFLKHPQTAPASKVRKGKGKSAKPTTIHHRYWHITTRKETFTGDKTKPIIDKANAIFAQIAKDHPGTPWASRANWEKRRGFGVRLYAYYRPEYKKVKNPIPIPKY